MKKINKIGVIGHVDHGKTTLSSVVHGLSVDNNEVVIVGLGVPEKYKNFGRTTLLINGKEYIEKLLANNTSGVKRGRIDEILEQGNAIYLTNIHGGYGNGRSRKLPKNTNIEEEFEKIQFKKSKLSRWERDEVVRLFLKKYEEVK